MCRTWKSCRCVHSITRICGTHNKECHFQQKYCDEAVQYLDRDTLHLLFPGLNKLLNFQRRFLIKVESIAEVPWNEQRWGLLFTDNVSRSAHPDFEADTESGTAIVPPRVYCVRRQPNGSLRNNRKKNSPSTSPTALTTPWRPRSCSRRSTTSRYASCSWLFCWTRSSSWVPPDSYRVWL